MAWTYLEYDRNGEQVGGEMPPQDACLLVFDALRWRVMIGYLEPSSVGGYTSVLTPDINDDCRWLAWAPLDERNEPDETLLAIAWQGDPSPLPGYSGQVPRLLRDLVRDRQRGAEVPISEGKPESSSTSGEEQ